MIIINSNWNIKKLDEYLQVDEDKNPIEIFFKIISKYGISVDKEHIDNNFLGDLADSILKKMDTKKKPSLSKGKKVIDRVLDIKSSNWYTLKLRFNDIIITILVKLNKKYKYVDVFIIDPYKSNNYCGHCRYMDELSYSKKKRGYIYWIKTNDPESLGCGIKNITGNIVLSFFITIGKVLKIDRIELEESAHRYCVSSIYKNEVEYDKYYTSIYDWITKGETWYERKGFIASPEKEIRDYNRYMINSKPNLLDRNKNQSFYDKYTKNLKFLKKIKVRNLNKIYKQILNNFHEYIKQSNDKLIHKNDILDISLSSYYMRSFLKTRTKKKTLKYFVKWIYNIDCHIYITFINTLMIFADMWGIDNVNNTKNIHFYNSRFINNELVNEIYRCLIFLTQRNYFYLDINE